MIIGEQAWFLMLFDLQNLGTLARKPKRTTTYSNDYTILIPISSRPIFKGLYDYLQDKKERVIIVDDSKDASLEQYVKFLKKNKFKVIKSKGKTFKWGALKGALEHVKTNNVVFLDDDTIPKKDFGYLVGQLEESKADLASVNVYPLNNNNYLEKLQDLEYRFAMLARQNRRWITSGACIPARTESIKKILDNHSGFREGGDIEIGLLARKMGYKVIHSEFEVDTEVPNTFWKWCDQRKKWMGGNFRHTCINAFAGKRDFIYMFYFTFLIWLHLPFRFFYVWLYPIVLPIVILIYIPITFISNLKISNNIFNPYILLYPLYAIFQVMIIAPFGIWWYFKSAKEQKNWGIIKINR